MFLIDSLCFPPQVPGAAVPTEEQSSADRSLRGPLHLRHGSSVLPGESLSGLQPHFLPVLFFLFHLRLCCLFLSTDLSGSVSQDFGSLTHRSA